MKVMGRSTAIIMPSKERAGGGGGSSADPGHCTIGSVAIVLVMLTITESVSLRIPIPVCKILRTDP